MKCQSNDNPMIFLNNVMWCDFAMIIPEKINLRICYLAGCRILLVINQEVEEKFKNL
ncbi:hypothetical protein DAPPUDRAFT_249868 [Daphnia pulex]|uniref:Uncharacterized protein n=1 Tax=Daphnia pulex TaxID=6669 RepID=E9GXE8_DAPPU|nr:hypothetical protein DAPPUDRAFT_249868 [Daphnia pulex]|eukprot:EFX75870.1 hypothetical protein DAPPUDRAFT_249868 [Daphnia pulex]